MVTMMMKSIGQSYRPFRTAKSIINVDKTNYAYRSRLSSLSYSKRPFVSARLHSTPRVFVSTNFHRCSYNTSTTLLSSSADTKTTNADFEPTSVSSEDSNTEKETLASPSNTTTTTTTSDASPPEQLEFQAETKQLLDIVTHSLYTDKQVFLRELVSNASDALEKLRHLQAANAIENLGDTPLEIRIDVDEVANTITITDTGVGMTREEMIENLGTIAKSGSKAFQDMINLQNTDQTTDADPAKQIIGRFGVGFYSAFMIADKVEVRSLSAQQVHGKDANTTTSVPQVWTSTGHGSYQIGNLPDNVRQSRGSTVVIHVSEQNQDFVNEARLEIILKQYSNFINFPIYLNGQRVNTIQAIWAQDPKTVTEDQYRDFYRYIANAVDDPLDTYHFYVDAPLDIKALFFIPSFHSEKFGMSRMESGVSLYSRKILIENKKSTNILPEWLRFVKGVVDSEDLPLSVSREKAQDTALIAKLRAVLTRKFIAHLAKMLKNDREKYLTEFYNEYNSFLKEGICQDYEFQPQLSKLLFYETSKTSRKELVSLDDYISRMRPEQKDIYYLVAPSREAALNSPYLEAFNKAKVEVVFLFTAIDDFVMANLSKYEDRKLVSVEKGDIDLSELIDKAAADDAEENEDDMYKAERALTSQEQLEFCNWFKAQLGQDKVASCSVTNRLSTSPAIVTDNESGAVRRMMRLVDSGETSRDSVALPKQHVEVNPQHPIIVGIYNLRKTEPTLANVLAEQVYDNCLVAAGLLDDSRSMLPRLNDLLICIVKGAKTQDKNVVSDSSSSDEGSDNDNDDKFVDVVTVVDNDDEFVDEATVVGNDDKFIDVVNVVDNDDEFVDEATVVGNDDKFIDIVTAVSNDGEKNKGTKESEAK